MGLFGKSAVSQLAEDVVRRDRAGDQNAHALIIECRKVADGKIPGDRARATAVIQAIVAYCNQHPVPSTTIAFGAQSSASSPPLLLPLPPDAVKGLSHLKGLVEYAGGDVADTDKLVHTSQLLVLLPIHRNTTDVASLVLANGAPLTIPRIDFLASVLASDELKTLFKQCVCGVPPPKGLPPTVVPVVHAGDIVGKARALQLARRPGNKLSGLSPVMGCEMGEDEP